MDTILKDVNGNILKDVSGKIVKNRPFTETIISNGLMFWGSADPNFLTLIDGLVSEAYDIRGTGEKMVQNTVANRLRFTAINNRNCLVSSGGLCALYKASTVSTFFMITRVGGSYKGLMTPSWQSRFTASPSAIYQYNNTNGYIFVDSNRVQLVNNEYSPGSSLHIFHSIDNLNLGEITLGNWSGLELIEWGWYNRILSNAEILYNINALNSKHLIF